MYVCIGRKAEMVYKMYDLMDAVIFSARRMIASLVSLQLQQERV